MWLDKYHVIRRFLLIVFTIFFLRVTNHIFFGGTASDTLKVSAYISFAGIITFMIKFYHDSRDIEVKNNSKDAIKVEIKNDK